MYGGGQNLSRYKQLPNIVLEEDLYNNTANQTPRVASQSKFTSYYNMTQ